MSNESRVVFVTGGSGTLGSEIVRTLNDRGLITVIGYNNSLLKSKSLISELTYPENSLLVKCNLEDINSIKKAFKSIYSNFNRLDFLVNNSAYTKNIPNNSIKEIDSITLDKIFNINFKGASFCSFEALKYFTKSESKCGVVNIVSNSLKTHNASNIMYIASKAALQSFTESMSVHYGEYARFNSVAPGLIRSNMTQGRYENSENIVMKKTPIGRLTTPKDVANTVKFLLLEDTVINGQTLYVDGGRTVGS
jgi:NAD(P)-dependent dehydrogenase (short-subunit alcohol dehydrogenase family)